MVYFSHSGFSKLTPYSGVFFISLLIPLKGISSSYYVQVGSYRVLSNAQRSLDKIEHGSHEKGRIIEVTYKNEPYYNVQFGDYSEFEAAKKAQKNLEKFVPSSFIKKQGSSVKSQPSSNASLVKHSQQTIQAISQPTPVLAAPPHRSLFSYPSLPYNPRALGDGALSTRTSFFNGDLLLPVMGNNDAIGYIDGGGKYGNDEAWFGGLGGGVRAAIDNRLWGGYFFVDYNDSIQNQSFVIANPGLELFINNWDAHLNGYVSMNGNNKSVGVFRGAQIGRPHAFYFENHTFHEYLFDIGDHTGPGLDGEVGYTLPFLNVRTFLGGYHFNINHASNINGVEGGVELPLGPNLTLRVHDAYDKVQQNAFLGTLRLTFGALPPSRTDVRSRMLDPIRRNLGSYQTGNGVPIVKTIRQLSRTRDTGNIWFFAPYGTLFNPAVGFNNCTFANPCNQFDQVAIDGINGFAPNALFFMETGTYNNPLAGSGLSLYSGQNINGRMNQFRDSAIGDYRPLINDTLILPGTNTLRNVYVHATLTNSLSGAVQVNSGATGNINIINSLISAEGTNTTVGVNGLLSTNNSANISLIGTDLVSHLTNAPTMNTQAINLQSSGPVTMTGGYASSYGEDVNNTSTANIQNSTITFKNAILQAYNNLDNGTITAALRLDGNSNITAINTRFNSTGVNNTNANSGVAGIAATTSNNGVLRLLNSSINVESDNNQGTGTYGYNGVSTQASFINTQINVNSDTASGIQAGLFTVGSSGELNVLNTQIKVTANNANLPNGVYGIDTTVPTYLNNTAIQVLLNTFNINSAIGIRSSTSLNYGSTSILVQNNQSYGSSVLIPSGSVFNRGNTICTTILNGVTTTGPCIG